MPAAAEPQPIGNGISSQRSRRANPRTQRTERANGRSQPAASAVSGWAFLPDHGSAASTSHPVMRCDRQGHFGSGRTSTVTPGRGGGPEPLRSRRSSRGRRACRLVRRRFLCLPIETDKNSPLASLRGVFEAVTDHVFALAHPQPMGPPERRRTCRLDVEIVKGAPRSAIIGCIRPQSEAVARGSAHERFARDDRRATDMAEDDQQHYGGDGLFHVIRWAELSGRLATYGCRASCPAGCVTAVIADCGAMICASGIAVNPEWP